MTWLNPALMSFHAAIDDAGIAANPWTAVGAIDADYPLTNLHDLRSQTQCRWTSAATTHSVTLDRGSTGLSTINALVIGNMSPTFATMKVEADDDVAFGSPTPLFAAASIFPGSGWTFFPLTANNERYVRISFPTTSITPQIGQLWFTYLGEMATRGPVQNWPQTIVSDRTVLPSGASLLNRTRRDRISLEWLKLDTADAKAVRHIANGIAANSPTLVLHDGNRPVLVRYPYGSASSSAVLRLMNVTRFEEEANTEVPADDDYLAHITAEFTETHQ